MLPKDLKHGIKTIKKLVQVESFPDEYHSLKAIQTVLSKSKILPLKTELHETVIRVRGRILGLHLKSLDGRKEHIISLNRDKLRLT